MPGTLLPHDIIRAFAQTGDGVLITEALLERPGPRIVYVNAAYEHMSGYPAEELLGRTPRILQGENTDRAMLERLRQTLAAGRPFHAETVNYRKDGSAYWVEWDIAPVRSADTDIAYFISIQRDVSARKLAEQTLAATMRELEESNAALRQFTSVVSHDLQDPLSTVRGFLELTTMVAGERLGKERDYIDTAIVAIDRMSAKIKELLAVARHEAEPAAAVDLEGLARTVLTDLSGRLAHVEAQIELGPLPPVRGHAIEIQQVVQNLVGNAIKYRHATRPFALSIAGERQDDGMVRLAVADNGIGIAPEHHATLFERWTRAAAHHTDGHGLGLSLVKRIVERHGGALWFDSAPDLGSTFFVTLPAAAAA